jgi:hypothetical protein
MDGEPMFHLLRYGRRRRTDVFSVGNIPSGTGGSHGREVRNRAR